MKPISDPFELLREDHERVAQLLDRIEATTGKTIGTRTKLLTSLKNEMYAHANLERDTLYSFLKDCESLRDTGIEAENEHELISSLVEELESIDPSTENWMMWFSVVKESIDHHIAAEEGELFQWMDAEFNATELSHLAEMIRTFKHEFIAA